MSVLAVPCDSVVILTKEQAEAIFKINNTDIPKEGQKQLLERARQLRRKPDKYING